MSNRTGHHARSRAAAILAAAIAVSGLMVLAAAPAAAATPAPTTSADIPSSALIGSDLHLEITFDNAATTAVGYGPYVDLFLPVTGADGDDGITFGAASYLGIPLQTVAVALACDGTDVNPWTAQPVACPSGFVAGDELRVLELPFGSFTPGQPSVLIDVTLALSELADADVALPIAVGSGFRFGSTPTGTTPITEAPTTSTVTPTVMSATKVLHAPDGETATGPNFERQWSIHVDIADAQLVEDLAVVDAIATNVVYAGVTATTPGGATVVVEPPTTGPQLPPDNELRVEWDAVTGSAGANDATVDFTFWIPDVDAEGGNVLDPDTGAPSHSDNAAIASGFWVPVDPRDDPQEVEAQTDVSTITDRSLAVQKRGDIVVDVGAPGPSPGDVVEWTLDFQVSDYFAFDEIVLADVIDDGYSIDTSFAPSLSATDGFSGSAGLSGAGLDPYVSIDTDDAPCGTGQIDFTLDVTSALADARGTADGTLIGGLALGEPNEGPATGAFTFRTVIDPDYRCAFGGGAVNSRDVLSNAVEISGTPIDPATGDPTTEPASTVTDASGDSFQIVSPGLVKSVYAINGDTADTGPQMMAGDVITYRLRGDLPITNSVDLEVADFLPLPIHPVAGFSTTLGAPPSATAPPAETASLGPDDEAAAVVGAPSIVVDTTANSLTFEYPDYQAGNGESSATFDLLISATVADEPFADGLFLTNQAHMTYGDSEAEPADVDAIVQVQLTQPELQVSKGVVARSPDNGTFSPPTVGPAGLSWSDPVGSLTPPRFTGGTVTSGGLEANPIGSDLQGADGSDFVTFAVVIENVGSGLGGAFNVTVNDVVPAGLLVPGDPGDLNFQVTDGAGTTMPYTELGAGFFDDGIVLDDPSSTEGSLSPYSETSATNLAVITFNLQVDPLIEWAASMTNEAELTRYSALPAAPNIVEEPLVADATVTTASPSIAKSIVDTSHSHTTGNTAAIGETITYEVEVALPEGETENVTVRDQLAAGLAFVGVDEVTVDAGITISNAPADWDTNPTVSSVGSGATAPGRLVTWDLGTVTNTSTDDTITFRYTAVMLNSTNNVVTANRANAASLRVDGSQVGNTGSASVALREPLLSVDKTADVSEADAGDTITYTVTVSAATGTTRTTAFDVVLEDVLPDGLTYVPASFAHTGGLAPNATDAVNLTAAWNEFAPGQSSTFTLQATVDFDAISYGTTATNTADVAWTSLPGPQGASVSPYNALGVERTGELTDVGGAANTYHDTDGAAVSLNPSSVVKEIIDTSHDGTDDTDVAIGEIVTYRITPSFPEGALGSVTVRDVLPTGMTYIDDSVEVFTSGHGLVEEFDGSWSDWTVDVVGQNVNVLFTDFEVVADNDPSDNSIVVELQARVVDVPGNVDGTTLSNIAQVVVGGQVSSSDDLDVDVVEPDLHITKTFDPEQAAQSDEVEITLQISNDGTAHAYDVVVEDLLDAQYLVDVVTTTPPAGWTVDTEAAGDDTLVRFAGDVLEMGDSVQFTFTATVADDVYPGSYLNTAAIAGWSIPDDTDNGREYENEGEDVLTFTIPDIVVEKSSDVDEIVPDGPIEYTIEISNDGTRDATGVLVTDALDPNVVFVSAGDGGSYDSGTHTVTWPAFDLAVDDTVTRTILVTVADPVPAGTTSIVNDVSAWDDGTHGDDPTPANNTDTDIIGVLSAPDVWVLKDDGVTSVEPGDSLTYTLTVGNEGDENAVDVEVIDELDPNVEFVSASDGGVYDSDTHTVAWPTFGLEGQDNEIVTRTVTVNVVNPVDAGVEEISNLAVVSAPLDVNPDNDSDTDVDELIAAPVLEVTKTDHEEETTSGSALTYEIVVSNTGNQGATGVVATDDLPPLVTYVDATGSTGHTYDGGEHSVTWDAFDLAAGASVTLTIDVTVNDPPFDTTVLVNFVEVADDGTNTGGIPVTDEDIDETIIGADIWVTKTDGRETVAPGEQLTYTIVVGNHGPQTVTELTLMDTLPAMLDDPVFEPSEGTYDVLTGLWSDVAIEAGATITMTVTGTVNLDATEDLVNAVAVDLVDMVDRNPEDNSALDVTGIVAVIDLSLTKQLEGDLVRGAEAVYVITVANDGPSRATGLVVTDELPDGLSYISGVGDGWVCAAQGSVVTCIREEPLEPGAETAIRLTVFVAADAPEGEIVNVASVDANEDVLRPEAVVDAAGAELGPMPEDPDRSGALPFTGATTWFLLMVALMMLGLGATVFERSRRRETTSGSR